MRYLHAFVLSAFAVVIAGCSKQDTPDPTPQPRYKTVYEFGQVSRQYSFTGNHYAYCPSVIVNADSTAEMFFCGNPDADVMVDNVFHTHISKDGAASVAESVLQPSLGWDSRHDCDPCVVEGEFRMKGVTYKYAMFFLSNPLEYYYNEIGVAFSNSLAGPWVKYERQLVSKPWSTEGDLYYSADGRCWGVGQPSAVSLDKKGTVMLFYTKGDKSGTQLFWRQVNLSDMSAPVLGDLHEMVRTGLVNLNGAADWTCDADFAVNVEKDKIVMVRPVMPHPATYPAYIPSTQEIDYMSFTEFKQGSGKWVSLGRIDPALSGFPRNHNACLARDSFGRIDAWRTPTVYFTVSGEAPDVAAETGRHAEWTYDIYKVSIEEKKVRID